MKFYRSLKDTDFEFDFNFLKKHDLADYGPVETMSDFANLVFDTMLTTLKSGDFLVRIKDDKMDELNEKINLLRDYPDDRETISVNINFVQMQEALELTRQKGLFQEFHLQDNPSNLMVLFVALYEVIMKHSDTRRSLYQIIDLHVGDKKTETSELEKDNTETFDSTPEDKNDDDLTPISQFFNIDSEKIKDVAKQYFKLQDHFLNILNNKEDKEQSETENKESSETEEMPSEAIEDNNIKSLEEALEIIIEQELGLQAKVHIYSQKELDMKQRAQDYSEKVKQVFKNVFDNLKNN